MGHARHAPTDGDREPHSAIDDALNGRTGFDVDAACQQLRRIGDGPSFGTGILDIGPLLGMGILGIGLSFGTDILGIGPSFGAGILSGGPSFGMGILGIGPSFGMDILGGRGVSGKKGRTLPP